jgi:hypothetical protein
MIEIHKNLKSVFDKVVTGAALQVNKRTYTTATPRGSGIE